MSLNAFKTELEIETETDIMNETEIATEIESLNGVGNGTKVDSD